jgi:2'-5' RNA ligase
MPATEPASAVIVRVSLPRPLARLRSQSDWAAGVGVPAHITVLFPFLPAERLDADVRRSLATIAAAAEPFEVNFAEVGRFPTVVYLTPKPSKPFTLLTDAVFEHFPEYPPYEGAFEVVIPHLTITESTAAPLEAIALEAARSLPFARKVTTLEVLVEGTEGHWHPRWRISLGRHDAKASG